VLLAKGRPKKDGTRPMLLLLLLLLLLRVMN